MAAKKAVFQSRGTFMNGIVIALVSVCFIICTDQCAWPMNEDGTIASMPLSFDDPEKDVNYDLCPEGAATVGTFLAAWQREDYETMYALIDDASKENYPFEQARFDLMFLSFKPYVISAIRKKGEDFEFFLSVGDWKTGDKELQKMVISGRTFKIIMPSKGVVFKKSVESYF